MIKSKGGIKLFWVDHYPSPSLKQRGDVDEFNEKSRYDDFGITCDSPFRVIVRR